MTSSIYTYTAKKLATIEGDLRSTLDKAVVFTDAYKHQQNWKFKLAAQSLAKFVNSVQPDSSAYLIVGSNPAQGHTVYRDSVSHLMQLVNVKASSGSVIALTRTDPEIIDMVDNSFIGNPSIMLSYTALAGALGHLRIAPTEQVAKIIQDQGDAIYRCG